MKDNKTKVLTESTDKEIIAKAMKILLEEMINSKTDNVSVITGNEKRQFEFTVKLTKIMEPNQNE